MENLPATWVPIWERPAPEPERVSEPVEEPVVEDDEDLDAQGGEGADDHGDEIALDRGVERRGVEGDKRGRRDESSGSDESSEGEILPTPRAKRVLKAPPKAIDTDVEMGNVDSEVEFLAVTDPKGKRAARSVSTSRSAAGTQGSEPDVGSSGAKRGLEDSPSQSRESAKRARRSVRPVGTREGLDLSQETYEEDGVVDPRVLPEIVGKVGIANRISCRR